MQKSKNRRQNRRTAKGTDALLGIVFGICLLVFMVLNLFVPDKEFSEDENRRLATRPKLTWDSISSGDYTEKYETYLSDQFAGRGILRNIKAALNHIGGSREENGVLIGKSGQLLETITTPDQEILADNLKAIRQFADNYKDVPVNMILVPDAANALSEKLPSLASVADQKRMIAQVKRELEGTVGWIDAENALHNHADEKIYYETDHHWTTTGAFYVFEAAAGQLGITGDYAGRFAVYPVTADFNGTLAAKSGCMEDSKEVIEIYAPKEGDNDLVVNYVDEQRKTTSLYDSSKLKTSNQYEVFLGGDSSVIDIKTVSESNRRLLVIKDSFANSFIPFLTPYFREVVVVDPQYYSGTIKDIMDTYRITDALILYSGNTFFQDNNISGVLSSGQQD